jgi:hypothetical protein
LADNVSSPHACKNGKLNGKTTLKNSSTVENRLHIHRTGCAETAFWLLSAFLSNIGSASIQCLSSRFVST